VNTTSVVIPDAHYVRFEDKWWEIIGNYYRFSFEAMIFSDSEHHESFEIIVLLHFNTFKLILIKKSKNS